MDWARCRPVASWEAWGSEASPWLAPRNVQPRQGAHGGHIVSPLTSTTPALPMTLPSTSAGSSLLADQFASASAPGSSPKASDTIVVAPGVPALKHSLVELITGGKFVDLGELPPAKGFGKTSSTLTSDMEGKIVLMQAAEYVQSKKHIPDLATWMQCFAIYSAVLLTKHPDRAQSLLMYSAIIARLSKKFRWPSWIIYDQYFRQEAADTGKTDLTAASMRNALQACRYVRRAGAPFVPLWTTSRQRAPTGRLMTYRARRGQ